MRAVRVLNATTLFLAACRGDGTTTTPNRAESAYMSFGDLTVRLEIPKRTYMPGEHFTVKTLTSSRSGKAFTYSFGVCITRPNDDGAQCPRATAHAGVGVEVGSSWPLIAPDDPSIYAVSVVGDRTLRHVLVGVVDD